MEEPLAYLSVDQGFNRADLSVESWTLSRDSQYSRK